MTAPAERKAAKKRISKTKRGQSCKRGCLMQFTVSQLAVWTEVTRIVGRHFNHVNTAGHCCHGPDAVGVGSKHQRAPHLSLQSRGWVRTLLSAGISSKEIMRKHQKQFAEDERDGKLTRELETASSNSKMCATLSTNLQRQYGSGMRMRQHQCDFSKIAMPKMSSSTQSSNQRSLPLTAKSGSTALCYGPCDR